MMTFEDLFPLWIEWQRAESLVTEKTLKEDLYIFNAHLVADPLSSAPIASLNVKDYVCFFRKITRGRCMSRKRFNNLKSVMNGILFYAVEQGYINHNPLLDINYSQFKFKAVNSEVLPFSENERFEIISYLPDDNIYDLAIKLMFYLTLRIGELKGLRFDDVQGNFIRVSRFVDDQHHIVDHIKGNSSAGIRWLPLSPDALDLIKKIQILNPDSDYLFLLDHENFKFLTTSTFNKHLKRCCAALRITYRSSHKIRFSTASILHINGVTVPELQLLLGHASPSMTHHYLKNVRSRGITRDKVIDIFDIKKSPDSQDFKRRQPDLNLLINFVFLITNVNLYCRSL